jgi:hypothetical protein
MVPSEGSGFAWDQPGLSWVGHSDTHKFNGFSSDYTMS